MKKVKWLILLLLVCCFIGCGEGDELKNSKKNTVEESGEATKEKEDKDDDENDEGDKNDVKENAAEEDAQKNAAEEKDDQEKKAAGHEVMSDNVADIFGLWYDKNNEWNLLIFTNGYGEFPNIGQAVLTNGYQDYLFCLDEKGRKGKDTIEICDEDGKSYKANMIFTEEGILIESIPELETEEMLFVRDGMYESEPVGGNRYTTKSNADYRVIQQTIGDRNTYYLLSDWETGEYVIAFVSGEDYTYYTDDFFCAKEVNVFFEQMLKGFTVVQLMNYEILSGGDFYNRYYVYDDGDDDGDNYEEYTPTCDFPRDYDWSYYDENTGL